MDAVTAAAGKALAAGDPLRALNLVALRDDAQALALRGIAMAQLGDLARARMLLRRAASAFGEREIAARARCVVAEAEIALVSRDLAWPTQPLEMAREALEKAGDFANAAHAGYLAIRRLLLIGRLDEAERLVEGFDPTPLPPASLAAYRMAVAGIAIRRLRIAAARRALEGAEQAARHARIASLSAEVEIMADILERPAARLISRGEEHALLLDDVEALLASNALVVDACRLSIRQEGQVARLEARPVLFALARALAEAFPGDAARAELLERAFGARHADESHRARLRVEMGRLRKALNRFAGVEATRNGFRLVPRDGNVAVLAPPTDEAHHTVLALLSDGEAWASSALALALDASPRTVQRALEELAAEGKVQPVGKGRARRWMTQPMPGFPTALLLPASLSGS